jgi:hypothetical protein
MSLAVFVCCSRESASSRTKSQTKPIKETEITEEVKELSQTRKSGQKVSLDQLEIWKSYQNCNQPIQNMCIMYKVSQIGQIRDYERKCRINQLKKCGLCERSK